MATDPKSGRTMRIDVALDEIGPPPGKPRTRTIRIRPRSEVRDPVADYNPLAGQEFQSLLQSFYDGTIIADLNGVILDMNRRVTQLVGTSREDLLGESALGLMVGADEDLLETIRDTVENERHVMLQAFVVREGEEDFPAEVAVNRLQLGGQDYLCFFLRDVSLRKQVQQQLRVEHSAVQNAGTGIVIAALDGSIRYGNPTFVRMWGCEDSESIRGDDVREVFADADEAERIVDVVLGGSTWEAEAQARRCDGMTFYVAVSATANLDEEDTITGLVFSFMDVDARRQAEEALRGYQSELEDIVSERTEGLREANLKLEQEIAERAAAQREIENTTHYLETIIRTSHDGILVVDAEGCFEFLNEAADRILGWPHQEIITKPFINVIPEDSHDFIMARWEEVQRGEGEPYEADILTKAGARRSLMVSHRDMVIGADSKYCVVIRDITARRQMEDDLREAIRTLERHNMEKTAFVSNVSHELRTPLTSIAYATDNLLDGVFGEVNDKVRDYLSMMRQDCERLTGTVQDILDLSCLEANRLCLRKRKVPVAWMVNRCAESIRILCEKKSQNLQLDVPTACGFALCDQRRLERALGNVLQNAVKFTPDNGSISLHTYPADGHAMISVTDTGVGIPAEHLPKVMDRYYRVGERVVGTGLGLSLCREIVELHGGDVTIVSPPPGEQSGTCVTLKLPIEEAPRIAVLAREGDVCERFLDILEDVRFTVEPWNPDQAPITVEATDKVDALVMDLSTCMSESLTLLAQTRGDPSDDVVGIVAVGGQDLSGAPTELLEAMHVPLVTTYDSNELIRAIENAIFGSNHHRNSD
ncbi:MAG: PAS domain S-box protein [Kiritimatiellia bacterium]|nr:PAS domain S-box protein [Kiritimatiellia bacterium]MDP7022665.1 PAS domain S-box protein [Kiritimatiellia bacterium]